MDRRIWQSAFAWLAEPSAFAASRLRRDSFAWLAEP